MTNTTEDVFTETPPEKYSSEAYVLVKGKKYGISNACGTCGYSFQFHRCAEPTVITGNGVIRGEIIDPVKF